MKILLSPLDWGLGHATRLIPIIRYLLSKQAEVHIAASGKGLEVLKKNFSEDRVTFHLLSDLNIQYSKKGGNFIWKLILQFPGLFLKKKKDANSILKLHRLHHYDIIISDNRYGVFAKGAYTIFITHQLQVLSGISSKADKKLLKYHSKLFKQYDEIWVPDHNSEELAITPKLSHPEKLLHQNIFYIGHLTQFNSKIESHSIKKENHIVVLLSGPEPARSLLLEKVIHQINNLSNYQFTIIAGSPLTKEYHLPSHIHLHGLLSKSEIELVIRDCSLVICRSGYSTVMDLMALNKKALFIPTPGQTEQEYIANELQSRMMFYSVPQEDLNLANDIPKAFSYNGFDSTYQKDVNEYFKKRVDDLFKII